MSGATCKACRYWEAFGNAPPLEDGLCRRHPPLVERGEDDDGDPISGSYWPETFAVDWCGEWMPRAEPDAAEGSS